MNKSNAKRVLMLLENCDYPNDDRVRHEAAFLTSLGYVVTVIAPASKGQSFYEYLDGVNIYRFIAPISASGVLGYMWEYGYSMVAIFLLSFYVFIRHGFDAVHAAHPPDTFGLIGGFYKLFGKYYVLDHHDLAPELYRYARFRGEGKLFIYRILIWFEKISFWLADLVVTTNHSYEEIALTRGQVSKERIVVVRNGPDLEELRSREVDQTLRATGKIIIGYVGVIGVQDGVDNLLRALNCLINDLEQKNFLCVIVGSGSAIPGLKALTKELKLDDYVMFTGWVNGQDAVARYLNTSDICVASEPSDLYNNRSTAAKLMEYMAMGKPIVSFDLPEHRYTAQEAAMFATPGDIIDYAKKIAILIDNPDERERMGRVGRERIYAELAWPHQAKKLGEAYERMFAAK